LSGIGHKQEAVGGCIDDKITVSVIISLLNAERFLEETIESVFEQTLKNWELLLIDDGSTDRSTGIARSFAEKYPDKVRYFEHPGHRNRGLPASRNVGIAHAAGVYIALLDADDVWLPGKLERQVAILDAHPDADLVYGATLYWHSWTADGELDTLALPGIPSDRIYTPPELLKLALSNRAVSPCPSDFMFRRASICGLGGFEESFLGIFSMYEDQAFLVKVYSDLVVYVSSECWDRYRVHPDQLCATIIRTGQKGRAEHFFLDWASEYISKHGKSDAEMTSIFQRRMWPYRHPLLNRLKQGSEKIAAKARSAFRLHGEKAS
jgi:glycosyltransferase involved in cell wall biosynthesis